MWWMLYFYTLFELLIVTYSVWDHKLIDDRVDVVVLPQPEFAFLPHFLLMGIKLDLQKII